MHHGANLRRDDANPPREGREGAPPHDVEEAFRRELLPRPLVRGPERADPGRRGRADDQLHVPLPREHVDVARHDDVHAVLELEPEELPVLAEQDAVDLRARVFEREETMARGRGLHVAHLAPHEDAAEEGIRADRLPDQAGELGDREGLRHGRSGRRRKGDRIHRHATRGERYESFWGRDGRKCPGPTGGSRGLEEILRG